MEKALIKQIELVELSKKWVIEALTGEKQKKTYHFLAECNRKLNKKKFSLDGNPAAALYGESQAGKSYLVSSLLSDNGKFMIQDGYGKDYNFKDDINPTGNDHESTSVITRFSTREKYIDKNYPIICKLLSPADLIMVLCESYYNNVKTDTTLSYNELTLKTNAIIEEFQGKKNCQTYIDEYDVLDIKDYFTQNFSKTTYQNLSDIAFFDRISEIIPRITFDRWKDVFSILWNCNPQITRLFGDLIDEFQKINFARTIYLPIDAILRSKGTVLDVERLTEIYQNNNASYTENDYQANTKLLYLDNNNKIECNMRKAIVCALIAELVICLPESFKKTRSFLEKTDLLDFPGTRRYENVDENDSISDASLTQLLRRGKVEYLFNKYSDSEKINVLLFCQNHKDSKQSVMPAKLNKWIGKMIGTTPAERADFKCPVPPLFIVSTWFNCDLQYDTKYGCINDMRQNWNDRFIKVLENQIIKTDTYNWFNNWTESKPYFQNIYLLRDFEKSSDSGRDVSRLFTGYNEMGREQSEIIPDHYPTFRQDLQKSFLEFDFVKNHFADPIKSWNEAATLNKDGSRLIIENLMIAADNINEARRQKNIIELQELKEEILAELNKHFHDSRSDALLEKAKTIAGKIRFDLDMSLGKDPYFFGKLMRAFMIDEGTSFQVIKNEINDLSNKSGINTDEYLGLRLDFPNLDPNESEEHNLREICEFYNLKSIEETKKFLEDKGVNIQDLIYANKNQVKDYPQILAEKLVEYWSVTHLSDKAQTICDLIASEADYQDIVEMFKLLLNKCNIVKHISDKIRPYTEGNIVKDDAVSMMADMATEILNSFIENVGYNYLTVDEIAELKEANDNNKLNLVFDHNNLTYKTNESEEVAKILEVFDNRAKLQNMTPIPKDIMMLPNYRHYLIWLDYMKIGFISVCDIPNYDVEKNIALKGIKDEISAIKYN